MHHPKPVAVSQRSQSIRLGAQSSWGYEGDAWFALPTPRLMLWDLCETAARFGWCIEMAAAVESFGSTEMLDSISMKCAFPS